MTSTRTGTHCIYAERFVNERVVAHWEGFIENNNKLATLESIIISAYENSNDQDTLTSIADLFNIELTKQIEFTATIEVNGIMRVPLNEGFDLETMLSDELSVSSYGNDVDILDYSIFEVSGSY